MNLFRTGEKGELVPISLMECLYGGRTIKQIIVDNVAVRKLNDRLETRITSRDNKISKLEEEIIQLQSDIEVMKKENRNLKVKELL